MSRYWPRNELKLTNIYHRNATLFSSWLELSFKGTNDLLRTFHVDVRGIKSKVLNEYTIKTENDQRHWSRRIHKNLTSEYCFQRSRIFPPKWSPNSKSESQAARKMHLLQEIRWISSFSNFKVDSDSRVERWLYVQEKFIQNIDLDNILSPISTKRLLFQTIIVFLFPRFFPLQFNDDCVYIREKGKNCSEYRPWRDISRTLESTKHLSFQIITIFSFRRLLHLQLCDIMKLVNTIFDSQLIELISITLLYLVMTLYYMYASIHGEQIDLSTILKILAMGLSLTICNSTKLVMTCSICEQATREVSRSSCRRSVQCSQARSTTRSNVQFCFTGKENKKYRPLDLSGRIRQRNERRGKKAGELPYSCEKSTNSK